MAGLDPTVAAVAAVQVTAAAWGQLVPPAHEPANPADPQRYALAVAVALAVGLGLGLAAGEWVPLMLAGATAAGLVALRELTARGH